MKPASTPNLMSSSSIPLPICDKIPSTIIVWDFSGRRGNEDEDDDDDDLDSMVSTLTSTSTTRNQTQTFEGDTPLAIVGRALLATHNNNKPAVTKQKRRRRRIFRL